MKEFNITGVCIKDMHYMVNVDDKKIKIIELIDKGKYFTINRARQYGKTTMINILYNELREKYLVIETSFEGLGDVAFSSESEFCKSFIYLITKRLKYNNISKKIIDNWEENKNNIEKLEELSEKITQLVNNNDKEIVLFIDEVDKSSDNKIFLNFLGMLRTKYLDRNKNLDKTFKSVILAGIYDIKNLKLKIRDDEERKYNSPWNIATEFKVDMSFNPFEIATMLYEYSEENNIHMDIKVISQEIYDNTSGYPFLVSKICKAIDEDLDKNFTIDNIQNAIKIILIERNTLFDDLIKNLENDKELYDTVSKIMIKGNTIDYNLANPIIDKGVMFSIFSKDSRQKLKIHNKIFEVYIYNYIISKIQTSNEEIINYETTNQFIDKNNDLDIQQVLIKFKELMEQEYREEDTAFLERQGRLLFLSFVKPIINGVGFYFVEPQTRTNKRMDIVITYNRKKYIIELKLWKGKVYEEKGVEQLLDYLDIQNEKKGYLVVFSFNKNKEYKAEWISKDGKDIFEVIV